jgi:hypothetical protein
MCGAQQNHHEAKTVCIGRLSCESNITGRMKIQPKKVPSNILGL